MTATLLANKESRDKILPLIRDIDTYTRNSITEPIEGFKKAIAEKQLEATVYSMFLKGDKSAIYKGLLIDKFSNAFKGTNAEASRLQDILKSINDGSIKDTDLYKTAGVFAELSGIKNLDKALAKASDIMQKKLIASYVYRDKLTKKTLDKIFNGEKLPKRFSSLYDSIEEVSRSISEYNSTIFTSKPLEDYEKFVNNKYDELSLSIDKSIKKLNKEIQSLQTKKASYGKTTEDNSIALAIAGTDTKTDDISKDANRRRRKMQELLWTSKEGKQNKTRIDKLKSYGLTEKEIANAKVKLLDMFKGSGLGPIEGIKQSIFIQDDFIKVFGKLKSKKINKTEIFEIDEKIKKIKGQVEELNNEKNIFPGKIKKEISEYAEDGIDRSIDKAVLDKYIIVTALTNPGKSIDSITSTIKKVYNEKSIKIRAEKLADAKLEDILAVVVNNTNSIDEATAIKLKKIIQSKQGIEEDTMSELISLYSKEVVTDEEKFDVMFKSLSDVLVAVNSKFQIKFDISQFSEIIQSNKSYSTIKKYLQDALKFDKGTLEKGKEYFEIKQWFQNYTNPSGSVFNLVIGGSKVSSLKNVVLLKIEPKGITKQAKEARDIASADKGIYSIELGDGVVRDQDDIIEHLIQNDNVDTIAVQTPNDLKSPAVKELQDKINTAIKEGEMKGKVVKGKIKDRIIQFVAPKKLLSSVFDVRDGKLIIGSDSFSIIDDYRRLGIERGSYPITNILEESKIAEIKQSWINLVFGDFTKQTQKILKNLMGESPLSIENLFRIPGKINKNTQYQILNPKDLVVTEDEVRQFAELQGLGDIGDFNVDDVRELYLRATKAPVGPTENQEIAAGLTEFAAYFGKDLVLKNDPALDDVASEVLTGLAKKGRTSILNDRGLLDTVKAFIDISDEGELVQKLIDNEYFQGMLTKHGEVIIDEIRTIIDEYKPLPSKKIGGEGLYLVYDPSKYGENIQFLADSLSTIVAKTPKELSNKVNIIKENISKAIDEYVNELTQELNKTGLKQISNSKQRQMKTKLFTTLKENEGLIETTLSTRFDSNVFNIPSGYTIDDVESVIRLGGDLKQRYGIKLDGYIDSIQKNGDNIAEKVAFNKGNVYTVNQNQIIESLIEGLPKGIDASMAIPDLRTLSVQGKADLIKSLRVVKDLYIKNIGIEAAIMDGFMEGAGRITIDYKNKMFSFSNGGSIMLPKALGEGQLPGIDADTTLSLKKDILKKVTDELTKDGLSGKKLDKIIAEEVEKLDLGLDLFNIKELLVNDFLPYTIIPKVDPSLIKEVNSRLLEKYSNEVDGFLANMQYVDLDGTKRPIFNRSNVDTTSYPDILYRTQEKINISAVQGTEYISKEQIRQNIYNAVDDLEYGMKASKSSEELANIFVKNEAKGILETFARGDNIVKVVNDSLDSGQVLAGRFTPWMTSVGSFLNNAWVFVGGTQRYNYDYFNDVIEGYNKYIKMNDKQFAEAFSISGADTSEASITAYLAAQHYKRMQKKFANITSDIDINKALQKDLEDVFSNIIKDGKFTSGGQRKLDGIVTSLKNGEIFHGLKTFSDLGIAYKKTKGNFFGFNSTFYDEGLSEFNRLFNTNVSQTQYRTITGALTGDIADAPMNARLRAINVFRYINSPLFRIAASIPGSILTGTISSGGYLGTILNYRKQFPNFANFDGVGKLRSKYGILESVGADMTAITTNFKVGVDEQWNGIEGLTKSKSILSDVGIRQIIGQSFDNGQNIMDAIFASTMKNQAVIMSLRSEGFNSLKDFDDAMNVASPSMRNTLLARIKTKAYDVHEGMVNYTGRGISKNIDNGTLGSKIAGVTSAILSPINFRAGLGNNAILNTASNITKLYKYIERYGADEYGMKLLDTVSKDPVLRQFLMSRLQDFAVALRLSNYNDHGESIEERELGMDDILNAMTVAGQNRQFLNMSAGFRILRAGLKESEQEEGNVAYRILSEYIRGTFRNYRVGRYFAEGVRVGMQGDSENAYAYLNKALNELSTAGMRYVVMDNKDKVFTPDTGLPTMFGGNNEEQEIFYYGAERVAQFNKAVEDGDWGTIMRNIKDMISISNGGMFIRQTVGGILDVYGNIDETSAAKWKEKLGIELDKSYLDEAKLVNSFNSSKEAERFSNGKYNFEIENIYAMTPDELNYKDIEQSEIIKTITNKYVVGSEDFKGIVEEFVKNGTTEYTTAKGFKFYKDETLEAILTSMKDDGSLDYVRNEMNQTRTSKETTASLTNYFNAYVDRMDKKPYNFDLRQAKSLNSYRYFDEVLDGKKALAKDIKKATGKKKVSTSDVDEMYLESNFVSKYLDSVQGVGSDGKRSWLGKDIALDIYAKVNEDNLNKLFFEYKVDGDKIKITGLKSQYKEAVTKQMEFEDGLAKGEFRGSTIAKGVYGPFSFFALKDGTGKYDKYANIEGVLHYSKFIDKMGGLSKDEKDELKINLMGSLPNNALDIKDIEEQMGVPLADEFRIRTFQSFRDSQKILWAGADADTSKGSVGGASAKAANIKASAIKIKEYVDRNKAAIYDDKLNLPKYKDSGYMQPRLSRGETQIRKPDFHGLSTSGSAKSVDLFPKKKTKTSPRIIKPLKQKKKKIVI